MIQIRGQGISTHQNNFDSLWFQVNDNGQEYYRVVVLRELRSLAIERQQAEEGLLGLTWAAMRGIHNARINFIYAALGIFHPENYVGVCQLYGAAANANTKAAAEKQAHQQADAVVATLFANHQAKVEAPSLSTMQWYLTFMRSSQPLVVLGHPDPRVKRRSDRIAEGLLSSEGTDDLAVEQNEILYRGLAAMQKSFVFQVNSRNISRELLTRQMAQVARIASDYASRQRGVRAMSLNLAIPILVNAGNTLNANVGHGANESLSNTLTNSQANTISESTSHSETNGLSSSVGGSESFGESVSRSESNGVSFSEGETHSWSHGESQGGSQSLGASWGESHGAAYTIGQGMNAGVGANAGVTANIGISQNESATESHGVNSGGSIVNSESWGQSDTIGGSHMQSRSESHSETNTITQSHTLSNSWSNTRSYAETDGVTKGESQQVGTAESIGVSQGKSNSRGAAEGISGGMSAGLSPGLSFSRSFQTEDDLDILTTHIVRRLEDQFYQASQAGGFMSAVQIFLEDDAGLDTAATLIPQAFHGNDTPMPIMTLQPEQEDQLVVMQHARAFLPWEAEDSQSTRDPFLGAAWTRYSMMLTPQQMAAYSAPAILQEGTLDLIAPIPSQAGFFANMEGEILLGHQFSPVTGALTAAPLKLTKDRLMHTMFCANTGFGKTVCAERMVYEAARNLGMRVVVLDFGWGWRKLLNAPGLEGKVDIRQLSSSEAVRPLHWNPLQIGRYIDPAVQLAAFIDLFGTVGQMSAKQQKPRLMDALKNIYRRFGVLVRDPEVLRDSQWGKVYDAEESALISLPEGTRLSDLDHESLQQIAVHRSKRVGLRDIYDQLEKSLADASKQRNQVAIGVLESLLWRLQGLVDGENASFFAPGPFTTAIEDLGRGQKQIVILEGGKHLDNQSKAFLLGWASWMIFTDLVERRSRQISMGECNTLMVFEEANIILTGMDATDPLSQGGPSVSEQFSNMFRDSRKYGIFFLVISQQPSLIPQGIRASCNNIVAGYLSDPSDKDYVLSAIARSEKGLHDEHWRRFLDDLRVGQVIGRFPYTFDRRQQLPVVFQPLMLNLPEPTDQEIARQLGTMN